MKRSIFNKGFFLALALTGLINNIQAQQDLASAILLTKSEQYDKAEALLQQLIQKEPANSKNYFYLGENILLDYAADTISNSLAIATKAAKEVYQKGVNANPGDPLNYIGLAKVAYYLGDDNTATQMRTQARSYLLPFKNIKKISPPAMDYAFALAKIAESYIKEGEVDTAIALPLIRQALKTDSKNAEIYLIAGDIYILANDGSNAIKNYNLAQYADPKSPTAYMKIGNIYVRGKSLQAAIGPFEEAIALDANYAPAYRELGQLYWMAKRLEQSKANFKKYLELTAGNIPAQTRYVNSLFYAGDYEEVIKNVEEILTVDESRSYMNRLAGYSYYEKDNPDYTKALGYMEKLFKTVDPERILAKDYHYMARILVKKNQNYPKMLEELSSLETQLQREKERYSDASAALKPKVKVSVDALAAKVSKLKTDIAIADKEIDRGFAEYSKVLNLRPQDRGLLSEMATNYYNFRRYDRAAKIWAQMIDPAKENNLNEYMQVGRAYHNGEKYKTADSVFNVVIKKSPGYVPAYLWIARTNSKMDPEYKTGLARPKFEKLIDVAKADSIKNEDEMMEAFGYLGYYHMIKDNYSRSKDYYNRMVTLNPNSRENKIKGYSGIGGVELRMAGNEKTNEGRLPFLARSADAYNKILALDPMNSYAKNQVNYIHEFEAQVRAGINPNEIKGVVRDASTGKPIPFASIRVKDTAAENLTNTKGEYKFEIPQGSEVLIISAKGYKAKEFPITKSRVYNASLEK
ncbi:MAG: carboxypeptidase-like regulatory domain-containing protein [Bacteroidales bacterium]|nr:carboxypeptidase-like regulatory domain-containing protein [Bacteroidales bacterium]